jgi:hypothetical protein
MMDSHWHALGVNSAIIETARDIFKSEAHTNRPD